MLHLHLLDKTVQEIEKLRVDLVSELRLVYPLEDYEDIDTDGPVKISSDTESNIIGEVNDERESFEECSISELLEIVKLLKLWDSIINFSEST